MHSIQMWCYFVASILYNQTTQGSWKHSDLFCSKGVWLIYWNHSNYNFCQWTVSDIKWFIPCFTSKGFRQPNHCALTAKVCLFTNCKKIAFRCKTSKRVYYSLYELLVLMNRWIYSINKTLLQISGGAPVVEWCSYGALSRHNVALFISYR